MHYLFRGLCVCAVVLLLARVEVGEAQERRSTAAQPAKASASIEPDEIDVQQAQRAAPRSRTGAVPAPAPGPTPATSLLAPGSEGGQKYETADCGTQEKPMTCCTKGEGPGASCNLFILLCNENGGAGKGDGGDAICVH